MVIEPFPQWKEELRNQSSKQPIFVGVHVRRGDRIHHWTEDAYIQFFEKAFEIYRNRYNNEQQEVLFLTVTDDVEWVKVFRICNLFHFYHISPSLYI